MNSSANTSWPIAECWLPFVQMGEEKTRPERLQEGVDLIVQIPNPNITEVSPAELYSGRPDVRKLEERL